MEISYPKSYRHEFFSRLARLTLRGESMLIFGPAGIGKTSDLQFLLQNETTRKEYFGNNEVVLHWIGGDELYESALQKHLEALTTLPRSGNQHVIIVVDHVDRLSNENYTPLFSAIRALRESSRPNVSVISLSNINLAKYPALGSLTPIQPLLLENIILVPTLSKDDTRSSLSLWEKFYEIKLDKKITEQIICDTNGFPRLIKRLVKLAADKQNLPEILKNPATDSKLKLDLENIASFNRANPEMAYKIPLLDRLEELTSADFDQIEKVRFYERLSRQEYILAKLLIERNGQLVTREEMISAVWPKNLLETSEHALDQMLHRVRKKLETARPKCELIVYRGRGVRLQV